MSGTGVGVGTARVQGLAGAGGLQTDTALAVLASVKSSGQH